MANKIIAIDFDGCLVECAYPDIGEPNENVIMAYFAERMAGTRFILWTCRCDKELAKALNWCNERGITFDAVNANLPERIEEYIFDSRKVSADEYWDDKAIRMGG